MGFGQKTNSEHIANNKESNFHTELSENVGKRSYV